MNLVQLMWELSWPLAKAFPEKGKATLTRFLTGGGGPFLRFVSYFADFFVLPA